jgi:hypothetical protein
MTRTRATTHPASLTMKGSRSTRCLARPLLLVLVAACAPFNAGAFYLPGSFPQEFVRNASIGVKVSSLTSVQTELPFGYYSLPFCQPAGGVRKMAENLGELLMGDRVVGSSCFKVEYTVHTLNFAWF